MQRKTERKQKVGAGLLDKLGPRLPVLLVLNTAGVLAVVGASLWSVFRGGGTGSGLRVQGSPVAVVVTNRQEAVTAGVQFATNAGPTVLTLELPFSTSRVGRTYAASLGGCVYVLGDSTRYGTLVSCLPSMLVFRDIGRYVVVRYADASPAVPFSGTEIDRDSEYGFPR